MQATTMAMAIVMAVAIATVKKEPKSERTNRLYESIHFRASSIESSQIMFRN